MEIPFGIIYKVTNLINGKCYIGQTTNLAKRLVSHKKSNSSIFHKAIKKYGWINFSFEIVKECTSKEELNLMETFMIIIHKSHIKENGYNITWGGEGGDVFTNNPNKEKIREKMSKRMKLNNPMFGKNHTEETIVKMKNHIFTEEHKEKIKVKATGRILTEETKEKIGVANTGKIQSIEDRKKKSEANKGKKHTEEWNINNSRAQEKIYRITFPDNHTENIKGLKNFCNIYSLCYSNMCKNLCKGWLVEKC